MDKILLISPNRRLLKHFQRILQESGFLVSISTSLEHSFLEVVQPEPLLVLVDRAAILSQLWEAQKFLGWFHHRSPVWLLCPRGCPGLESQYDRCLPKTVDKDSLLSAIGDLRR